MIIENFDINHPKVSYTKSVKDDKVSLNICYIKESYAYNKNKILFAQKEGYEYEY